LKINTLYLLIPNYFLLFSASKYNHRKEREAREEKARMERYYGVLDKFISEGRQSQRDFALSKRDCYFNEQESMKVYFGIMALAQKSGLSLHNSNDVHTATTGFLDGCNWSGMTQSREDNCRSWTTLFTGREVSFPNGVIDTFCAFVDHMSCSAETYVSLGGSNGCADQLTNWDGTQKRGLGAPTRKKGLSV